MAEAAVNPRVQAWAQDLESVGRVEIKSSFKSLIWRVVLALAIVTVFIYARYQAGDIGQRGLTIAVVGFALLIVGCIAFVKWKYGDSSLLVEHDGVTMVDGMRVSWNDIEDVTIFSAPRSDDSVQVNLTEAAWKVHMDQQGRGGRLLHNANKLVTRNRSLVIPSYLDARPAELAAWLNMYARGKDSASV